MIDTISSWTNLAILSIFIIINTCVALAISNVARKLVYETCLNIITCYSSFQQSKLDIAMRQQKLLIESEQARIIIREQRLQLLDKVSK